MIRLSVVGRRGGLNVAIGKRYRGSHPWFGIQPVGRWKMARHRIDQRRGPDPRGRSRAVDQIEKSAADKTAHSRYTTCLSVQATLLFALKTQAIALRAKADAD